VAKNIADRGNIDPRDLGVFRFDVIGMWREASEMTSMHRSTARCVFWSEE
jgi:hypothetical protein